MSLDDSDTDCDLSFSAHDLRTILFSYQVDYWLCRTLRNKRRHYGNEQTLLVTEDRSPVSIQRRDICFPVSETEVTVVMPSHLMTENLETPPIVYS
jgi:hypothetical protein